MYGLEEFWDMFTSLQLWSWGESNCSQESEPHQLQSNFWFWDGVWVSDCSQETEPHQLQSNLIPGVEAVGVVTAVKILKFTNCTPNSEHSHSPQRNQNQISLCCGEHSMRSIGLWLVQNEESESNFPLNSFHNFTILAQPNKHAFTFYLLLQHEYDYLHGRELWFKNIMWGRYEIILQCQKRGLIQGLHFALTTIIAHLNFLDFYLDTCQAFNPEQAEGYLCIFPPLW